MEEEENMQLEVAKNALAMLSEEELKEIEERTEYLFKSTTLTWLGCFALSFVFWCGLIYLVCQA